VAFLTDASISPRLDRVDWNFPSAGTSAGSVHTLHWFPGNFIPQIPSALIQLLSSPGDIVLDPFCGSGTTGIEALRLGRQAVISDALSACVMIARGKFALLTGGLGRRLRSSLIANLTFDQQCRSDHVGSRGEGGNPELEAWFAADTLAQLRYLWRLIESVGAEETRRVLEAIFSDVLFDCASPGASQTATGLRRRHHWGWIADNVRPRALATHNAIRLFQTRLIALGDVPLIEPPVGRGLTIQQDARALSLRDEFADLVVTSPPYVSVIDYTHANRLLYTWMGWSMRTEREYEIGARFRRKRLSASSEYLADMRRARDEIYRVLRAGSACAVVIGESKAFPGIAEQVLFDFDAVMPIAWGPVRRTPSRRRVSDRDAREPVEFVCVFRKR
jgi:hypothetical protein